MLKIFRKSSVLNELAYRALRSMFLSNIVIGAVNVLLQIYFARILGVIIVADYAKIVVVAQLVSIFTTYSFNHALIGIGYSVGGFQTLLILTAAQLAVSIGVWIVVGTTLRIELSEEYSRLILPGVLYVLGSMALVPAHTLNCSTEAQLGYPKIALIRCISFGVAAVGATFLSLAVKNVYAMVTRDFINGLTFLLVSWLFFKGSFVFKYDAAIAKKIIVFSKQMWLVRSSSEGAVRVNYAILGLILDSYQFGLYFQIRSMVDGILAFFLSPVQTVLFSYFRLNRDELKFRYIAIILSVCFLVLAGLGCIFFYFYGERLIGLLLGQKWVPGHVTLIPMAIYASIILYFEVIVSIAQAINRMWPIIVARISWIFAVAMTVPPMTAQYKLDGAGWSTAVASILMLAVGMIVLFPRLEIKMRAGN